MGSFLLVGGSSDIGILLTKKLVEGGNKVTLLVRDESRVSDLPEEMVERFVGDANDEGLVLKAVQSCIMSGDGTIDGVAHLVGSFSVRPPHAMNREAFEEVLSTNLTSAFVTLSVACKQMLRAGGGRVVFTSSVAGSLGLMNHEAISAAKGGVESMVRSAAATYSKRGIRVNAVAPGWTMTPKKAESGLDEEIAERAKSTMALKKLATPEDVASAIVVLSSDEVSGHITGQVLSLIHISEPTRPY